MICALIFSVALAGDALRRADEDAGVAKVRSDMELGDYHSLKSSVGRLQAITVDRDLMHPWAQGLGNMAQFVGSSFVVDNKPGEGPTFITNAHVVENAAVLAAQIPAYGQKTYKAKVVMINHDMDIAFVKLDGAEIVEDFEMDMAKTKEGVKPVPLYTGPLKVGMEVVAMGYPLGMTTAKVSTGVLSGHETVGALSAYQHTAPISPGSSGGPAFKKGTNEVVMINFATANAENSEFNNYGIPGWRVQQMVNMYNKAKGPTEGLEVPQQGAALIQTSNSIKHSTGVEEGEFNRYDCAVDRSLCGIALPKKHAALTPGTKALYQRYNGESGVYASKILPNSYLSQANPPVAEKSFITEVNGIPIDNFGQGVNSEFFNDPMPFEDLLFSKADLSEPLTLKSSGCGGQITEHTVSVMYKPNEADAVPTINEPIYSKLDFEQFGDVTIQPLTTNLAQQMIQLGAQQLIGEITNPLPKASLIVTDVDAESATAKQLAVGSLIKSINGKDVNTLEELRANFKPMGDVKQDCEAEGGSVLEKGKAAHDGWTLETKDGVQLTFPYAETLDKQKMMIMQGMKPLTMAVKTAILAMESGEAEQAQTEEEEPAAEGGDDFADDPLFKNPLIAGMMAPQNSTEAGPSLLQQAQWAPIEDRVIGRGGAATPFKIPLPW